MVDKNDGMISGILAGKPNLHESASGFQTARVVLTVTASGYGDKAGKESIIELKAFGDVVRDACALSQGDRVLVSYKLGSRAGKPAADGRIFHNLESIDHVDRCSQAIRRGQSGSTAATGSSATAFDSQRRTILTIEARLVGMPSRKACGAVPLFSPSPRFRPSLTLQQGPSRLLQAVKARSVLRFRCTTPVRVAHPR